MMTQPIQMFENLTSETSPAGGNDIAKTTLTFEERRILELRARYARAEWRYVRMPGVGHWLQIERPDDTNALLVDWFGRPTGVR